MIISINLVKKVIENRTIWSDENINNIDDFVDDQYPVIEQQKTEEFENPIKKSNKKKTNNEVDSYINTYPVNKYNMINDNILYIEVPTVIEPLAYCEYLYSLSFWDDVQVNKYEIIKLIENDYSDDLLYISSNNADIIYEIKKEILSILLSEDESG